MLFLFSTISTKSERSASLEPLIHNKFQKKVKTVRLSALMSDIKSPSAVPKF